jgi:hypothetical protein
MLDFPTRALSFETHRFAMLLRMRSSSAGCGLV